MRIQSIRWTEDRVAHVARHGVTPGEVDEVFRGRPLVMRGRGKGGLRTYLAFGRTAAGRNLVAVFRPLGGGAAFVLTAREMDDAERKLYRGSRP